MIPFSSDVFLRLFEQYNAAIWPAQVLAYALGALAVFLAVKPRPGGERAIGAILAAFWLWTGVVYHMMYFAAINWAAWAFGAMFALQGVLLLWHGGFKNRLRFRVATNRHAWAGLGLVSVALIVYPIAGWALGRPWPQAAAFGVAPCPTTIFTLGVLLLAEPRVPLRLLAIPVLWSLIGGTAAWLLEVPEDLLLLLAGALAVPLAIAKNRAAAKVRSAPTR